MYPSLFRTSEAESLGISQHRLLYDPRFRAVIDGIHRDELRLVERPTPSWADDAWMDESLTLRAMTMAVPGRKVSRKGINVRRHNLSEGAYWLGMPMHSPVGVFLDLSAVLTRDELVALGDSIVGRWHGPPLCSLEFLRTKIAERRYLRNRKRVEAAMSLVRESVDSPQETDLRLWAINCGLPEPVVHPPVRCPLVNRTVVPDLGYPHAKLALEYEGDHHRASRSQWNSDITRDEALRQQGWEVLKVTSQTNRIRLEHKIRYYLEQRSGIAG